MALENLTGSNVFITNLVPSNPAGTDPVSEGDNHIAGTKNVLLNSFPAINGAVTATPADLNKTSTLDTVYAKLDSPAFIGIPTAPTAAPGTNTTQLATTAFSAAAAAAAGIGIGQAWQDVHSQRSGNNTVYQNTTGKPIMLYISPNNVGGGSITVSVDGVSWVQVGNSSSGGSIANNVLVPVGHYYRCSMTNQNILLWAELR